MATDPARIPDERIYRAIGTRIRRLRGAMSQQAFGSLVKLSRTSIANIEAGRQRLPVHHLVHLAIRLECDLMELLPSRDELVGAAPKQRQRGRPRYIGDPTPQTKQVVELLLRSVK